MNTKRLLLVETEKERLNSRVKSLVHEGYRVTGVKTIEEAIETATGDDYELLIIKPETPDLLNMLLARFPADMAVLVITSPQNINQVVESASLGIHTFLIEPFTTQKLKLTIARALNTRQSIIDTLRSRTLDMLCQATNLLTPGIDIDKYLQIVAEMSAIGTAADCVAISLKNERSGDLQVKTRYGESKTAWEKLCTQVTLIDEPAIINPGTDTRADEQLAAAGVSSLMRLPLTVKGEASGVITCVRSLEKKPFTESDKNFASVLAWWGGVALENTKLFRQVEQQRVRVENLLEEVSQAQENERKRVAIEIHDGVAQWMVGATYSIKACAQLVSESRLVELEAELAKIGQTLQKSVRELRRTIANLRPLALEEGGLETAIRQVVQPLIEQGITCQLHVDSRMPPLSFPQETTTYWILQETLSNVRTHAHATSVEIHLGVKNSMMTMTVTDNGRGFDATDVIKNAIPLEHMGLLGMQERARLLGGVLNIVSETGRGTMVELSFPLTAPEPIKVMA